MLPDHLAIARRNLGLSQSALASRAGVARLAITRLETGVGSNELLDRVMPLVELRLAKIGRGQTLFDQLRNRRLRRGWTLEEAADKAGLTRKTVSAVEAGDGSVASLMKLLAVVAPEAELSHPPKASWSFDPSVLAERDQRFTPRWFFDHVVTAFGPVSLDPCGHAQSAVEASRRIILPECGLAASWAGARLVYVNPPYSATKLWLDRATEEWEREPKTIIMLVPTRTDSDTFQNQISRDADVIFIARRFRFDTPNGPALPVPFSLMVVIYGGAEAAIKHFQRLVPGVRMKPWGSIYHRLI